MEHIIADFGTLAILTLLADLADEKHFLFADMKLSGLRLKCFFI